MFDAPSRVTRGLKQTDAGGGGCQANLHSKELMAK